MPGRSLGPAGDCERVREGHVEGGHDQAGLLRAHAYATDRTADDLAADPVARRIDPEELREDADSDR